MVFGKTEFCKILPSPDVKNGVLFSINFECKGYKSERRKKNASIHTSTNSSLGKSLGFTGDKDIQTPRTMNKIRNLPILGKFLRPFLTCQAEGMLPNVKANVLCNFYIYIITYVYSVANFSKC